MGKVKQSDIDRLKESGKLSASAVKELKKSNSISTKRTSVKRYIKTANGTYVIPSLYFRGGKGLEPSKEMIKFQTEYDKLLTKYTTTTNK